MIHHKTFIMGSIVLRRSYIWGYLCQQEKKEIKIETFLREHAGAAGLDGLNLGLAPRETAETSRELSAIEELARAGLNGAERRSGLTADAASGEGGATERAVLLCLGSVGGEGVRESSGGRGGVNARTVVHGLWLGVSFTRC